jgi:site-specific DNA recombinase
MRVALYARVSSESQEARGTIGSQLEVLRARIRAEGHELVAEFCDDGYSGARLDRPGLDKLRDQAEAGAFEAVWCLTPDRLARAYAYQVLILDELTQLGVRVLFSDAPALDDDDPQLRLLTQVQGVIAEWERAKISERNRRGRLWRARAGEVVSWKAPYGYRRVPRDASGPARLEIFEPEAAVVRRIYDNYVNGGHSIRQVMRHLNTDQIATPTGKTVWWHSTVCRVLRNEAYIGRVYFNQTETVPTTSVSGQRRSATQRRRPREEWIAIPCPAIVHDAIFDAAQRVTSDNSKWSPRNLHDEAWLLRGLIRCGACDTSVNCHKMGAKAGTIHHYYWCRNHASNGVPGEQRCPERSIRADALDTFVFEQVRAALLRPEVLSAGQAAVTAAIPSSDDQLLATELARLERKLDANQAERRRLADLYQSGLLELSEVQRRARDVDIRHRSLTEQRDGLIAQRQQLAVDNRLQQRVSDFARRAAVGIDKLTFEQRQQLLRLIVDHVRVTGWQVEIHLRIPLDDHPGGPDRPSNRRPDYGRRRRATRPPRADDRQGAAVAVSSKDGLRSLRRVCWPERTSRRPNPRPRRQRSPPRSSGRPAGRGARSASPKRPWPRPDGTHRWSTSAASPTNWASTCRRTTDPVIGRPATATARWRCAAPATTARVRPACRPAHSPSRPRNRTTQPRSNARPAGRVIAHGPMRHRQHDNDASQRQRYHGQQRKQQRQTPPAAETRHPAAKATRASGSRSSLPREPTTRLARTRSPYA